MLAALKTRSFGESFRFLIHFRGLKGIRRCPSGLSQYSDVLLKHGFDDLEILVDVQAVGQVWVIEPVASRFSFGGQKKILYFE